MYKVKNDPDLEIVCNIFCLQKQSQNNLRKKMTLTLGYPQGEVKVFRT